MRTNGPLTRSAHWVAFAMVALVSTACAKSSEPNDQSKPSNKENKEIVNAPPKSSPSVQELAIDAPLEAGLVAFQGMVRPTKGGYDVRGVIVDDDQLPKALAGAPGADAKNGEWFLGAIVRIVGDMRKHEPAPASKDGIVMQMRSGTWFSMARIDSAEVVKPAEVIAGPLARSKGFFTVAGRLVSADDVAWSLGPSGGREGDQVRLYGQSRTVVCEPNAQCLIEGSLPLFDVGRAERGP